MDEGMCEIVDFVEAAVGQIWSKYDKDDGGKGNGYLDQEETRTFINDTLK
jgi:hypothetical protein